MAAPTFSAINVRGTSQVYPVTNGTTLGSQDGSNISSSAETAVTDAASRAANRVLEFRGERLALIHDGVHERDEGGAGTWGQQRQLLTTDPDSSDGFNSGLHIVHISGVPKVVLQFCSTVGTGQEWHTFWKEEPGSTRLNHGTVTSGPFQVGETVTSSSGGSATIASVDLRATNRITVHSVTGNFNDTDTLTGGTSGATATQSGASALTWYNAWMGRAAGRVAYGQSIAFRTSVFWWAGGGPTNHLGQYNYASSSYTGFDSLAPSNAYTSPSFCIVDNDLYLLTPVGGGAWVLRRYNGSAFPSIATITGTTAAQTYAGSCCWADGHDLICFIPGSDGANDGDQFFRVSNLSGSPSVTDVTSSYLTAGNGGDAYAPLGGSATNGSAWDVMVDNSVSPRGVHLWRDSNGSSSQTRTAWTWNYRRITTGTWTGTFTVGETVTQATTGATGRVTGISADTYLELTDVTGTFNNSATITGGDSGASAAASSLLVEQALTSDGSSISSDYAIPFVVNGVEPYLPTDPSASPTSPRIELEGEPEEVLTGTKILFRVYGTGSTVTATFYLDTGEEAPEITLDLVATSVAIEFGSPATTPANTAASVTNITPDKGYAQYSVIVDLDTPGVSPGDQITIGARLA